MTDGAEVRREPSIDGPVSPTRGVTRPRFPTLLPSTEPDYPRKAAKPAKPRKVEKRHRGRKG